MKVLLVAATPFESAPLCDRLGLVAGQSLNWKAEDGNVLEISLLTTGVGMVNTAYQLGRRLAQDPPDLALQMGIGGAFAGGPDLLEVVEIVEEAYPELGADSPEGYLSLVEMGFPQFSIAGEAFYNVLKQPRAAISGFEACRAVTVNRVSGEANAIAQLMARWSPQVESMEGAAFFQACLLAGIPFRQFRAISNHVEPRNRANWKMKEAIATLNQTVFDLLFQASQDRLTL